MTVTSSVRESQHIGNGVTTAFSTGFKFFANSEVQVISTIIATGVESAKVENTDYTLTGAGSVSGGTVTFTTAPASTERITIRGTVPYTQGDDYTEFTKFPAETLERGLDRAAMRDQQLAEKLNKALFFPSGDPITLSGELPSAAARANKFATYDGNGEPSVADLVVTGTPVTDYMAGLLAEATRYALRNAIGLQACAHNLIANPCFSIGLNSMPSGPADNDYIAQKWRVLMESANAVVPTLIDNSALSTTDTLDGEPIFVKDRLRLTVGATNNAKFGIFQTLDEDTTNAIKGDFTASLQAFIRTSGSGITNVRMAILNYAGAPDAAAIANDPISSWGADGTNPTLAANWNYMNTPVALADVGSATHRIKIEGIQETTGTWNLGVLIWVDDKATTTTTDWIEISNVQLERGEICSDFVFPYPAVDRLRCQREYEFIGGNSKVIGSGVALTSTTARVCVPMQAFKRIVPTLTISSAGHFSVDDGTGTPVACSAIALNAASTQQMALLDITVASGLTAGRATILTSTNASALMEFNARL